MQTITRRIMAAGILLFALCSFISPFGGDSYEITIGNRQVLKHYVHDSKKIPTITLTKENLGEKLGVSYSHCGITGSKRMITIRTEGGSEKTWKFTDATNAAYLVGGSASMKVGVNDVMELKSKNGNKKMKLYYYSKELPEGRMLVVIE